MIEVSVIVATAGRPQLLVRLLDSLCAQDFPRDRWEVRVAIDGSDAGTVTVLQNFVDRLPGLRWSESGRRSGPATARNTAWRDTTGAIVAMTDDDCEPRPGWLSAIQAEFARDAALGGLVGRTVTDRERLTPFSHYVENLEGRGHETCNSAYRRTVLEQLDGFDERFPFAYLEDTDFYCRACEITRVEFRPSVEVLHPPREGTVLGVARSARRFEADFIFYGKNPELYRRRHEGHGPLVCVLWDVATKHSLKQILSQGRWLVRHPVTYFRWVMAMTLFGLHLWLHAPGYYWRHRAPGPAA